MHPLMMILMMAGGHSMMGFQGKHQVKVPTAVMEVRASVCPVKGGPPQEKFVTLRRNRVYRFCSQDCIERFRENPRPFLRKLEHAQHVPLKTTNPDGHDPVSGHPINARKNPPFLIRGNSITFYASLETVGKDSDQFRGKETSHKGHSGEKTPVSHSGNHGGNSMMCH